MVRVRAGISYALSEAMDEGHCGLPTGELIPLAEKLFEVPQELIHTALDLEQKDRTVIADRIGETDCISQTSVVELKGWVPYLVGACLGRSADQLPGLRRRCVRCGKEPSAPPKRCSPRVTVARVLKRSRCGRPI
jgi:hypothetical protein